MESKEYIKMRSDSASTEKSEGEIAALKKKFQDLLDSTDLKKADEVLSKIMTIFLADLSLHLSADKEKDLSAGKLQCAIGAEPIKTMDNISPPKLTANQITAAEEKAVDKSNSQIAKYKSSEWLLVNSRSDSEIRRNLKKIELKDLDTYLKGAPETSFKDSEKYLGVYKGWVIDIDNKQHALLSVSLRPIKNEKNQDRIRGRITFRKDQNESESEFTSQGLGYSPSGFSGAIHSLGNRRIQFYSVQESRRLAGYVYEHLPNGTTKTIGTFILNRVDQF